MKSPRQNEGFFCIVSKGQDQLDIDKPYVIG